MADISQYLQAIMQAVYGEEVRGSIHDAIEIINDVGEKTLTIGTAVTGPTSSSVGYYDNSLYLNSDTWELWKCVGTNLWQSQGDVKGPQGAPGQDGDNGNKWYIGTGVSGTSTTPTVFPSSGVVEANVNDCFLNNSEGRIYHCTLGGDASTARWVYDFTMTGGGGGGSYTAGTGIDISPADVISIDPGTIASGNQGPVTGGDAYTALSKKAFISTVPTKTTQLTDISGATPNDDDILVYDVATHKYAPVAPAWSTVSIAGHGTASASSTHEQRITIDGTAYDIDGTKYMEYNATASSFTFTNAAITADSAVDVYSSIFGESPSNVQTSAGACVVTFPTSAARTVRIYIK